MRNIYEAAERQSAALATYVEQLARERGWAARTISGMIMNVPPGSGRPLMIYGASILLPHGRAASFIPAQQPRIDGETWMVDIRRSDGVSRPEWNQGIAIKKVNGSYKLMSGTEPVDEEIIAKILEAVGTP